MNEMDDVVREFLVESNEGLDQLDRDLVALEQDPGNRDLLARIFRCIHTVKGTCGFLGFSKLESVTHVGESLLALLRDGARRMNPDRATALLRLVDAVREILGHIEQSGEEGDGNYDALVATLTELQGPDAPAAATPVEPEAEVEAPVKNMGDILIERGLVEPEQVAEAAEEQKKGDPRRIGEILVEKAHVPPHAIVEALESQTDAKPGSSVADSSVRVDVGLLDRLMNLVGELVLARNQIVQHPIVGQDGMLAATCQRLNLITTELQEGVMKTRMQPIGTIWSRFPRVVRDLSVTCKKQVRVEMEGKETELDRTIIEAIKDPLTHIVRNSVDHGIEKPADRVKAGKPAEGCLQMRAFHEGGQVNIEIIDDGGGINPVKIKAKAVQKGLLTQEQADRMSDREAVNLIFAPGFSTAEQVTNVSGRGVGMDVVRTNIERIGGTVDVTSVLGQGTTLRIKIPLTLAIVPALIVSAGSQRYAIPQVSLVELVRVDGDDIPRAIETIDGTPLYRLRGNLLPLVQLTHALRLVANRWAPPTDRPINIVVLQADGVTFGLVVDEVNDTQEIVVKPLGKHLKGLTGFAGATIMGDGRVALILDVFGIAQGAGVAGKVRDRSMPGESLEVADSDQSAWRTLLLFDVGEGRRFAVPLSSVARLEEFPPTAVEVAEGREVVQYRGGIMPLGRVADVLGCADSRDPEANLAVVVHGAGRERVGLVVGRVHDIVEESVTYPPEAAGRIVAVSTVIQGKVTDVLDVGALARSFGTLQTSGGHGG